MQDRIRDILQQQIAMTGGKQQRKGNRWTMFLQTMEKELGIPYNEAMVDPDVKQLYKEVYGSATVGGYGTKRGAKKNRWDRYLEQEHIDPRQAEMQGYDAFQMEGGELIGGVGNKEGAKKNKWLNFLRNDYTRQPGVKLENAYKLFKEGKYEKLIGPRQNKKSIKENSKKSSVHKSIIK